MLRLGGLEAEKCLLLFLELLLLVLELTQEALLLGHCPLLLLLQGLLLGQLKLLHP